MTLLSVPIATLPKARTRRGRDALARRQTLGHNLFDGLVGFWPLDDNPPSSTGVAQKMRDAHGGLTLTATANNPYRTDGPGCVASYFTKSTQVYCSRASEAAVQTGDIDFSLMVWTYPVSLSANGEEPAAKGGTGGTWEWFLETYSSGGNHVRFRYGAGDCDNVEAGYTLNAWHMIICWHDPTANTMNYELDNNGTVRSVSNSGGTTTNSDDFRIGGGILTATRCFDGRLCRVGMWKRILTTEERAYLWNGGIGRAYPFL